MSARDLPSQLEGKPPGYLHVVGWGSRGRTPGTLYVIEPELEEIETNVDAHGMDRPSWVSRWPHRQRRRWPSSGTCLSL
jgi:hypothetical protein